MAKRLHGSALTVARYLDWYHVDRYVDALFINED